MGNIENEFWKWETMKYNFGKGTNLETEKVMETVWNLEVEEIQFVIGALGQGGRCCVCIHSYTMLYYDEFGG